MPETSTQSPSVLSKLPLVQWLVGIGLAIVAGYGTVQFAYGSILKDIDNLKSDVTSNRQASESQFREVKDGMVKREEWNLFFDMYKQDRQDMKSALQKLQEQRNTRR